MLKKYFAFELWREFKLSVSEILSVFPNWNTIFCDKNIIILDNISQEEINKKADHLWWTIKIMSVWEVFWNLEDIFDENMNLEWFEWKYNYAINKFWSTKTENIWLKDILKISKSVIKSHNLNPRFINQDFKNISSVAIIKEALIKKETDFNIIFDSEKIYFWNTVWVQNIYSYSNRDYGKDRDMNIWMLPPKLAQMMINIWVWEKTNQNIYDPFVGLWTVLIEWIYMWNQKVFWSDLSERMVETSIVNLEKIKWNFNFNHKIFFQNAKYIHEIKILNEVDVIITEWYLWEIMTQNNINIERIEKQITKLSDLYEWFFAWLKKLNFKWNIVISFPFWEIKWKYFYFEEIYHILDKYCEVNNLLNDKTEFLPSKSWSLLYKRDNQLVWREIFSLKIKY